MIIRAAEEKDIPALVVLEKDGFLSPWKEEQFRYELKENPYAMILVADFNGTIIGMIDFWITFETGQINQITVLSPLRKKGIGSILLKEALSRMESAGVEQVTLEVRVQNETAKQFYRSFGFEKILTKPHYYENGDDADYMMRKRK